MEKGYATFWKLMGKEKLKKYIRISYKKLKSHVFYDKSDVITRDEIVKFEKNLEDCLEKKLDDIASLLMGEVVDDKVWDDYEKEILSSIKIITLPKHIESNETDDDENNSVIFNKNLNKKIEIADFQYRIDMNIEGHILGVLWILVIGRYLDKKGNMYEHSYGNRLRKNLFEDDKEATYYPGLFEPYFSQYTTWRDNGLEAAKENLKNGEDVIILTMDFERYYYSVNYTEDEFKKILTTIDICPSSKHKIISFINRLNSFVFNVIKTYSEEIHKKCENEKLWSKKDNSKEDNNNLLPIGFLPSNILANYRLNLLDSMINTRWNPIYYGRYVDDIIIVDKVEKNSILHKLIYNPLAKASDIIDLYLQNCNAKKCVPCESKLSRALFCKNIMEEKSDTAKNTDYYYINPVLLTEEWNNLYVKENNDGEKALSDDTSKSHDAQISEINGSVRIKIQNKKVRLFAFNNDSSDRLIACFQNEIFKNSSEFRFLAPADTVFSINSYSKVFNINYRDSINKISSVKDIAINKFELSKFLGKQMSVNLLADVPDDPNFDELLKLMVDDILIDNYLLWERVLEILVLRKDFKNIELFTNNISKALEKISFGQDENKKSACKQSLLRIFISDCSRVMALIWGSDIQKTIGKICHILSHLDSEDETVKCKDIANRRPCYCYTRMLNKYLVALSMECIIDKLHEQVKKLEIYNEAGNDLKKSRSIALFRFEDVINLVNDTGVAQEDYFYCPTVITPHELNLAMYTAKIQSGNNNYYINDAEINKKSNYYYLLLNYHIENAGNSSDGNGFGEDKLEDVIKVSSSMSPDNPAAESPDKVCISIKGNNKSNLRVALANTRIFGDYFQNVLKGFSNRSLERYEKLEEVLRMAVKEKVDLIVFPEGYVPYEWVSRLMRFSATNNIAIITGIEQFGVINSTRETFRRTILNYTAVILPYKINTYTFAYLTFHEKTYLAPGEIKEIEDRCHSIHEGNTLHLFYWHDVWFSVYCCFELASVATRSAFKNFADLVVAVECNRDTNYFSNIIESLCRDMHCYCLQVNASQYGDSRLVMPASSYMMNVMRVKGGKNEAILVEDVNITALREVQTVKYAGAKDNKLHFKPTPPGFDMEIVHDKLHKRTDKIIEKLFGRGNGANQ